MSTVEIPLTLHLRWGHDSAREITVPVEIRKGSYSHRYELYVDDTHVGWVVKYKGRWESFLCAAQNGGYQRQTCFGEDTRKEAIYDLVGRLSDYARTNVLASRAEEAYA